MASPNAGEMTTAQSEALADLCARYNVDFHEGNFPPCPFLPTGWVAGWIDDRIYVGCAPDGSISS